MRGGEVEGIEERGVVLLPGEYWDNRPGHLNLNSLNIIHSRVTSIIIYVLEGYQSAVPRDWMYYTTILL